MTGRKWLWRAIALIILSVGIVIALGAGVLVPYFLAGWTARIPILVGSAVIAVTVIGWVSAWATARIWPLRYRKRFTAITTAVFTASFTLALYVAVLRPSPHVPLPTSSGNTKYWQLPTGSRIAYSEYDPPFDASLKPEPILFLHGGPGFAISPFEHSFFKQFAADGYRVYLFDQAGSGLSGFLPVRQYTVPRFVDDLEAIRQQIGAEKLILIGHSWGSTLEASYIAKHPAHVAKKVVFYSPGAIWDWAKYHSDPSRAAHAPFKPAFPRLRLLAALYLSENRHSPEAAEELLPQREAETLFVPLIAPETYEQVCSGDTRELPPFVISLQTDANLNPGFNPYVTVRLWTEVSEDAQLDPHPRLRGNRTPAIVLFSECDFIPWTASLDYRRTFENAKIYYIPRAGHIILLAQPELMGASSGRSYSTSLTPSLLTAETQTRARFNPKSPCSCCRLLGNWASPRIVDDLSLHGRCAKMEMRKGAKAKE